MATTAVNVLAFPKKSIADKFADDSKKLESEGNRLRARDIEPLFNQAIKLIEIASAERKEFETARMAANAAGREYNRTYAAMYDAAERLERTKSEAASLSKTSISTAAAWSLASDQLKIVQGVYDDYFKQSAMNNAIDFAATLAELGAYPPFNDDCPDKDPASPVHIRDNPISGGKGTVPGMLRSFSREVAKRSLELEKLGMDAHIKQLESQKTMISASGEAEKIKLASVGVLDRYLTRLFNYHRKAAASIHADVKDPEGVVAKMEARLDALEERFSVALAAAHIRLYAVCIGAQAIYKGVLQLDDVPSPGSPWSVDEAIAWVRKASSQFASMDRCTQDSVLVVPITSSGSQNSFEADVVEEKYFEDSFVGTRGISLTLKSDAKPLPVSIAYVSPPAWSFDNNPPVVRVARIARWSETKLPDVFGLNSLYNWSPFGKWTIKSDYDLAGAHLHVNVTSLRKKDV